MTTCPSTRAEPTDEVHSVRLDHRFPTQDDEVVNPVVPRRLTALAGLVSGALAVTLGMVLTAWNDAASPIDAVGSSFIDRVPRWLKEWAITTFGENDKVALQTGIVIVLAAVAMVSGATSNERPTTFVVTTAVFALVGLLSALDRPTSNAMSYVAPIAGAVAGVVAFSATMGRLRPWWRDRMVPHESKAPLGWDRRRFLRTTGAVGALSVAGGVVARVGERNRLDDLEAQRDVSLPAVTDAVEVVGDGFHPTEPYITPNDRFYRIDTALSFPFVDVNKWRLTIDGMVERPLTFTYEELRERSDLERTITLCCVSNEVGGKYVGNAVWQGVRLADLLSEAGVDPLAEQVFSTSADGWTCGFPLEIARDGRDAMVAIGMNGTSLPIAHGFPARLVVPGLYGYVSATKWLTRITLNRWDDAEGYWVPRGWSRLGPVKTQSRIDVPRRGEEVAVGPHRLAGVAWAQHTGVARVEVRIDDGPWQDATLSDDLTDDAWRQWVLDWDATPGEHTVTVRATDKSGYRQTEAVAPVAPDGATGWHQRTFSVV